MDNQKMLDLRYYVGVFNAQNESNRRVKVSGGKSALWIYNNDKQVGLMDKLTISFFEKSKFSFNDLKMLHDIQECLLQKSIDVLKINVIVSDVIKEQTKWRG